MREVDFCMLEELGDVGAKWVHRALYLRSDRIFNSHDCWMPSPEGRLTRNNNESFEL